MSEGNTPQQDYPEEKNKESFQELSPLPSLDDEDQKEEEAHAEDQPQDYVEGEEGNQENDQEDKLDVSLDNEIKEEIQNDNQNEGDNEADSKKKKRRHHHHHHRKHKHRRHSEDPDASDAEQPEPTTKRRKKKEKVEGKSKLKKVKGDEDLEQLKIIDEQVDKLIENISQASDSDKQSKEERKPALAKIALLPTLKVQLKKKQYHEPFLSKGGLQALGLWMQRYEDGTYACFDILQGVIELCNELPIRTDNLLEHGRDLARSIKEIYKTNESEQLRVKAKRLIDKWTREINGANIESYNLSEKERGYVQYLRHLNATTSNTEGQEDPQREEASEEGDFEDIGVTPRTANRLAPPAKGSLAAISKIGFDFFRRPPSEFVMEEKKTESCLTPLMRKMIQVKRDGRKKGTSSFKPKSGF